MIKIILSKRNTILILTGFFIIFLILFEIIDSALEKNSSDGRLRFNSIPVAISILYHNHPHDYTAIRSVALSFQSSGRDTNDLINFNIGRSPVELQGVYYLAGDDRGYVDFVTLAFKIFGPNVSSLGYLWFLIFFISYIIYVGSFKNSLFSLLCINFILAGIYTYIGVIPSLNYNISEQRIIELLGFIPTLHIIRYNDRENLNKFNLISQCLILTFIFFCRSTSLYLILFITIFLIIKKNKVPLYFTLFFYLLLFPYKAYFFNQDYIDGDNGQRVFWHNALMGLSAHHGKFYKSYRIDDYLIAEKVIEYAQNSTCDKSVRDLTPRSLLNSVGGHGHANWYEYDQCARVLFMNEINDDLLDSLALFFIYKPRNIYQTLKNSMDSPPKFIDSKKYNVNLNFFNFPAIIIILLSVILYKKIKLSSLLSLYLPFLLLAILSLAPSIVFYANITNLVGFIVLIQALIVLSIVVFINISIKLIFKLKYLM